ncbi:uncharacterized protein LOC128730147 [Anopheles nili]|uniref:uncharacterized protein LOC128730147 n=1 Tax=Anopheles nili TaxID=185578 RepID=UPI00237BD578|nr:uncharacterized protein LOC128730147 [Anopheles nili]
MYHHSDDENDSVGEQQQQQQQQQQQSIARSKKQTHLKANVAGDRVSCDSGISVEDPALTATSSVSSVTRRPKDTGGGLSHVRRLMQLFENLSHEELRQERAHDPEVMSSTVIAHHPPWELLREMSEEGQLPSPEVSDQPTVALLRAVPCQVVQCPAELVVTEESENPTAEVENHSEVEIAQDALAPSENEAADRVMALGVRSSARVSQGGVAGGRKRLSRRRTAQPDPLVAAGGGARVLSYGSDKIDETDYYGYDDDEFDTSEDEPDGMETNKEHHTNDEEASAGSVQTNRSNAFNHGSTTAAAADAMFDVSSEGEFGERAPLKATEDLGPISEAHNVHVPGVTGEFGDSGAPYYGEDDEFSSSSFDSDSDDGYAVRPDSDSSLKTARVTSILQELLANEAAYVQTLGRGIENYVGFMGGRDMPPGLRGQKFHIFGNIEKIHSLHQNQFLPMLESNRASIAGIAETFIRFLESDKFYCYIMFALNRPKSERICNRNLDFFQRRQLEVGDMLGLNSFLLSPIQRLPRYKLLLAEINKEILKQLEDTLLDSVKDEIATLCKAEKRLERFIDIVNEAMSINDIQECYEGPNCVQTELMNQYLAINLFGPGLNAPMVLILRTHKDHNPAKRKPINLFSQGKFRKMFEVDIYDWDHRRRYPAKIFLFERSAIYTEKVRDHLEYRGRYDESEVGIHNENRNKVYLYARKRGLQEIEVICGDLNEAQRLSHHVERMMQDFAVNERDRVNTLVRPRIPSVMTLNRRSTITSSTSSISTVNSMRDSYESSSQTTWSTDKPIAQLATMQKNFCRIMAANRRHYFNELPVELASKVDDFMRAYDRILQVHTKRLYTDLSRPDTTIDEVCEMFIEYFKDGVFDVYNDYIRLFKPAAEVLKNIHKVSRSSISDSMVAQTMDEFTFLCVQHWSKLEHFFQALVVQIADKLNADSMENQDLFRKLAYIEVQVAGFRKQLFQNYRLFNMDVNVTPDMLGLVVYSDRVKYDNETISSHRVLLCDRAVVCVKFRFAREFGRQTEKYTGLAFVDRFSRNRKASNVRISKKSEVRLNVLQNELKHAIDFGNTANRDKFYGQYSTVFARQTQ